MKQKIAIIAIIILFIAAALLVFAAPLAARGQPSNPPPTQDAPAYSPHVVTPESVTQSFTAWNAVALLIGGVIWHMILKVAPWAKANGGLFKGVVKFFWDFDNPVPAPKPPINTAPVELSPTSMR